METVVEHAEIPHPETELSFSHGINPNIARIIAATYEPTLLQPDKTIDSSQAESFKTHLSTVTSEAINFTGVENMSTQSRVEHSQGKSFNEYNQEWNRKVWKFVQNHSQDENALKAFNSLGFNPENQTNNTNGLNEEVEKFRLKYFSGKSKVKEFVSDIAQDCQENGVLNMELFENRLNSISGLLGVFGKNLSIQQLILDYSASFAILSQPTESKQALADEILTFVEQPIASDNHNVLRDLAPLMIIVPVASVWASSATTPQYPIPDWSTYHQSDDSNEELSHGPDRSSGHEHHIETPQFAHSSFDHHHHSDSFQDESHFGIGEHEYDNDYGDHEHGHDRDHDSDHDDHDGDDHDGGDYDGGGDGD